MYSYVGRARKEEGGAAPFVGFAPGLFRFEDVLCAYYMLSFFARQTQFLQTLAEAQKRPGSTQSPHICHTPATTVHQGGPNRGTQPHRAEELCVRKLGLTLGLWSSVSCCVSSRVIFKGCFMGIVLSWLESRYAALICLKKQ